MADKTDQKPAASASKKVYTNNDLTETPKAAAVETKAQPDSSTKKEPAESGKSVEPAKDEAYWRDQRISKAG